MKRNNIKRHYINFSINIFKSSLKVLGFLLLSLSLSKFNNLAIANEIKSNLKEVNNVIVANNINMDLRDGEVLIREDKNLGEGSSRLNRDRRGDVIVLDESGEGDISDSEELDINNNDIGNLIEEEINKEEKNVLPKKRVGEVRKRNFVDTVTLQGLDKITAKIHNFDAKVGEKVEYERLVIEVLKCWKSPPTETPENKVLMKVWEKKPIEKRFKKSFFSKTEEKKGYEMEEVFFGWMFSSSPGLSGLEHPVYDITIIDCRDSSLDEVSQKQEES